ncbi:uncharacterized protein [Montipora capricornis]|uniref:uncharacterized protein isoform X2 n=1 Tax=Montipora capricornis TaxID=246305 RepID=UPI0035F165F2
MLSTIFTVTIVSLMIKHKAAAVSDNNTIFGSTRGCNSVCQKECIDVINKYRINHQAKKVAFSQFLADKAQKWADGGRFGYDMKSRGKFGQLIEWDVKGELNNFTAVIKHWHDKERDFDFTSGRSRTGKTLHDFTQIVWKKAHKAGCGQSEIFGSKYYVVWMDSDGIVRPNERRRTPNIGSPQKDDLHWYETGLKRKPKTILRSKFKEGPSSTRAVVAPDGSTVSIAGKVQYNQSKPISIPQMKELQDGQRALKSNPLLRHYLYPDSLNNVILDENMDTASYHVVAGTEDKAKWQKGAESLIQLDKNSSEPSTEPKTRENAGVVTFPSDYEDARKQAAKFQSLVIQDDDILRKKAEGENKESATSEGNGGEEIGEADEDKQADDIQSMMKQEDDMIQHETDDTYDESTGSNASKIASDEEYGKYVTDSLSASPKMAQRQATSYYISGVALNNDPISSFTGVDSNSSSDSSSVTYNIVLSDDADKQEIHNGMITKGTNESNSSKSPSVATKSTGFSVAEVKTNVSSNKEGKNLEPLSKSKVVSLQTSAKTSSKPQNGGPSKQESTPVSSNSSYRGRLTGSDNAMTSTNSSAVEGVKSVSSVHQVSSPAVITLPDSTSRPIKLVFHTKDMNNVDVTSKVYQLTTMHNDVGKTLNDNGCHDDTLQCKLWEKNGHCTGIAYTGFMKRHCKATCGYCGLPSIIKETAELTKTNSLSQDGQDEPCEDTPSYEFSCLRWQAQGYCEKRETEMKSFCRKTCDFCVPRKETSSLPHTSGSFLESGVHLLSDDPKSNTRQPSTILRQPSTSPAIPRIEQSQRKPLTTFGTSTFRNAKGGIVGLVSNEGSNFKEDGNIKQLSKQQSIFLPGERARTQNQLNPQTLRFSQGKSNKMPIKFKLLRGVNRRLKDLSLSKNGLGQKFTAQGDDELIEKGLKALQNRVQAPLEISAVAKSKSGCGHRLCKEKVKTQHAKARAIIRNHGGSGLYVENNPRNSAVATKGCDVRCQQECLAAHNRYRLNHGAPPLILDQTLASQAQQWADKKVFKHSPWAGGQGGETIALGSLYPSFTAAVKAWHDEEKDYNWSTGTGEGGMKVNHFTQVVWKRAHFLGCGKTRVSGEPYYIAQMDIPGVIAGVPGYDKSNVGRPKEPDLGWFMDSSPYWKEMQTKDSIPKNIEHRIL